MRAFANNPRCRGEPIASFLIKPIQRIMRYLLLLRTLDKKTPDMHPDKVGLSDAITKLDSVNDFVNSELKRHQDLTKLRQIEENFDWEITLIESDRPKRRLIRESTYVCHCHFKQDSPGPTEWTVSTMNGLKPEFKKLNFYILTDMIIVFEIKNSGEFVLIANTGISACTAFILADDTQRELSSINEAEARKTSDTIEISQNTAEFIVLDSFDLSIFIQQPDKKSSSELAQELQHLIENRRKSTLSVSQREAPESKSLAPSPSASGTDQARLRRRIFESRINVEEDLQAALGPAEDDDFEFEDAKLEYSGYVSVYKIKQTKKDKQLHQITFSSERLKIFFYEDFLFFCEEEDKSYNYVDSIQLSDFYIVRDLTQVASSVFSEIGCKLVVKDSNQGLAFALASADRSFYYILIPETEETKSLVVQLLKIYCKGSLCSICKKRFGGLFNSKHVCWMW
jgi:hypothetical protein